MRWRRSPTADPTDPNGVADLLARACDIGGGGVVQGTRFLFRTEDMLEVSREIERAALLDPAVPLFVGVQRGHRLDAQRAVYGPLIAAGVVVHAFGTDEGPEIEGVHWTQVPEDPHELLSQWFVVRAGGRPRALVGFELRSQVGPPRRRWEGFASGDPVLVERLVAHLAEQAGAEQSSGVSSAG